MDTDRQFGVATVLVGEKTGKYPHGNSVLVRGRNGTLIIDPSLSVVARGDEFRDGVDFVVLSHVHEDHVAGVHLFPKAEVHAHRLDAPGLRSLDGLMQIYGYGELDAAMRELVVSNFHYVARPDTRDYEDAALFDLGNAAVRAFHLPGHTRGHCALMVEPAGLLFLGDIDLTGFGPYYGDAWSDLDDFEKSLNLISVIDARVWVSFHHAGIIEDRRTFEEKLRRFLGKIAEREHNIVTYLGEPHTMEEMVAHRFLYPPHANLPFIDAVEKRTIEQHLKRLLTRGDVQQVDESRYRTLRSTEH